MSVHGPLGKEGLPNPGDGPEKLQGAPAPEVVAQPQPVGDTHDGKTASIDAVEPDLSNLDPGTKAYIKALKEENEQNRIALRDSAAANHRIATALEKQNKGSWVKTAAVIGAIALVGVGAFFLGKSSEHDGDKVVTQPVAGHVNDTNDKSHQQQSRLNTQAGLDHIAQVQAQDGASDALGNLDDIFAGFGSSFTPANTHSSNGRATASERLNPISSDSSVDTLDESVKAYDAKNFDQAVSDILGHPDAVKNVDISHKYNRYANLEKFGENMPTQDAVEAKLIAIENDKANATSALNSLEGKPHAAERAESHAQMVKKIKGLLLSDGVTINGNDRLNGTWLNGRVDENTGEINSSPIVYRNKRAITISGPNIHSLTFTVDSARDDVPGNCLNDQEKVVTIPTTPIVSRHISTAVMTPENIRIVLTPGTKPVLKPGPKEQPKTPPVIKKTPPVITNPGKDARLSPISSDPNDPREVVRPNIDAPAVAPQPEGAPAVDPHVVTPTVPDPRPEGSEGTPTSGVSGDGQGNGAETVPANTNVEGVQPESFKEK